MMKRLVLGVVLCAVLAGAWFAFGRMPDSVPAGHARKPGGSPLSVEITHVAERAVPIRLEAVGQVESGHIVQVRPQITGVLNKVAFAEGDEVKAGQLLFQIDPAPFEAALAQANAALTRDQATLAKARWQRRRTERLAKRNYVTPQDLEDARAAAKVAAAAVAVDEAAVMQAKIQLRYTEIRSPIAGRTGAIAFKGGNLVEANSSTPLVTINQIAPILVRFSISQERLGELRRYQAAGSVRIVIPASAANASKANPPAPAADPAGEIGRLVFVDNTVDPLTGTVMLKAQFPNKSRFLWPGQYVNLQMELAVQPHAVVVPDSAVQPAQQGGLVYVVRDGRAHATPVSVARQIDGWSVIAAGVKPGEAIVAKLPRNLRDGRAVKPIPPAGARRDRDGTDRASRP